MPLRCVERGSGCSAMESPAARRFIDPSAREFLPRKRPDGAPRRGNVKQFVSPETSPAPAVLYPRGKTPTAGPGERDHGEMDPGGRVSLLRREIHGDLEEVRLSAAG